MKDRNARWKKIPVAVYIGMAIGGSFGAFIGNALCLGYNIVNGPFLPQAGVDPQPAGWAGWWIAAGGAAGAIVGLAMSAFIVMLWRLAHGPRQVS